MDDILEQLSFFTRQIKAEINGLKGLIGYANIGINDILSKLTLFRYLLSPFNQL